MATMTKVRGVLDALVDNIPALLAAGGYGPDSCVRATRTACLALNEVGLKGSPLAVGFGGYSPRYVAALRNGEVDAHAPLKDASGDVLDRLAAEGAWSVLIGHPSTPRHPGRWPGHLVTLVERRWLVDVTLHQASRPAKGMVFEPHYLRVTPGFMAGAAATFSSREAIGVYQRIENNTYLVSPDWAGVSRDDPMVRSLARTLRDFR